MKKDNFMSCGHELIHARFFCNSCQKFKCFKFSLCANVINECFPDFSNIDWLGRFIAIGICYVILLIEGLVLFSL